MCSCIWGRSKERSAKHFNAHPLRNSSPPLQTCVPEPMHGSGRHQLRSRHQSIVLHFVKFGVLARPLIGAAAKGYCFLKSLSSGDEEHCHAAEPIGFPLTGLASPKEITIYA